MAGEPQIIVIGNLTADPELRHTQQGLAVVNFTIASTPRDKGEGESWKDGEPTFFRASCWRDLAEHVAASLLKGQRVIAYGRMRTRTYETKEGEKRSDLVLEVEAIGPDLRYAVCTTVKAGSATQARNREAQNAGKDDAPPPRGYEVGEATRERAARVDPAAVAAADDAPSVPGSYADETPF